MYLTLLGSDWGDTLAVDRIDHQKLFVQSPKLLAMSSQSEQKEDIVRSLVAFDDKRQLQHNFADVDIFLDVRDRSLTIDDV